MSSSRRVDTVASHLRCPASPRASSATVRGSARSVVPWVTRQAAVPTTCAGSSVELEFDTAEAGRGVHRQISRTPGRPRAAIRLRCIAQNCRCRRITCCGIPGRATSTIRRALSMSWRPSLGCDPAPPTPGPIRGQLGAGLSLAHPANPAAMVQPSFPVATGACARRPSKPQSWPPALGWASRRADMDLGRGPTRREAAETLAITGWPSSPARIVSDPELLRLHPRAAAAPDERRRVHGPARQGQATPPRS